MKDNDRVAKAIEGYQEVHQLIQSTIGALIHIQELAFEQCRREINQPRDVPSSTPKDWCSNG